MKVKNGTNSDTEEEEEEMNVEKDFQDGFVKPEEIANIDLFKSCLALQKWNELPLKEGVRCPCLEKFTQMRCTNAVNIDAPVQLVKGYEEGELNKMVSSGVRYTQEMAREILSRARIRNLVRRYGG